MIRQKLRKGILLISFLLFPVTLFYFSPVLVMQGASEGIVTGSLVLFILQFVSGIFLGRGFCSWVCPAGGLQECLVLANNKKVKGGRFDFIKYLIWAPWLLAIITFFVYAGGVRAINITYQTSHGISVMNMIAYIIYYGVVSLIVILSLIFGKRSFCHYACWMAPFMVIGRKLGSWIHAPRLTLKINNNNCIHCNKCSKQCPMSLDVENMVKRGNMENSECILCGECIDCCPKGVIGYQGTTVNCQESKVDDCI